MFRRGMLMAVLGMAAIAAGILKSSADSARGVVCIAPVRASNPNPISLANPAGGSRKFGFEVSIDGRKRLQVDHAESLVIKGLDPKKRHMVAIYRNGGLITSFRFSFSDYRSRSLCLWFKELYETWSLWDYRDSRTVGCKCSTDQGE
jgi:hypothetical protein